ncbi:MAG: sugar ABC transporter permease, partial [Oscillospiraceae bacterium]|nr:sugar ABC transporter permease [Oscillospiraceae bacterium]
MASKALRAQNIKKNQPIVNKTPTEKAADVLYWFLRGAILVNIVMLFFPAFNPARLSGMINKNLSLFSCGISYDSIVANFGRAFRQEWVLEETFKTLNLLSAVVIIAIILAAAGGCMSLGNRKLKKLGCVFS